MKVKEILTSVVLMVATCGALAADWPQYLGPDRNSTSQEKGILRSWPEDGPEVLWAVDVGRGYGGPVIKDGKVYLRYIREMGRWSCIEKDMTLHLLKKSER